MFTGASPIDDLVLVVRDKATATAIQAPGLNLDVVESELSIKPLDQILGHNAVVFVEGENDVLF